MNLLDRTRLKGTLKQEQKAKAHWFQKEYSKKVLEPVPYYPHTYSPEVDQQVLDFLQGKVDDIKGQ